MNRMQKKCTMVTVGIHLLLLLILIVGPGFFMPKPKAINQPILTFIPANLVDTALNQGVRNAEPPPPAPVVTPPPAPTPPPPQPVLTPPPAPAPQIERPEPLKPERLRPEDVKPIEPRTPPKPQDRRIQINTTLVMRLPPRNATAKTDESAKRAERAINSAISAIRSNLSPTTKIDMPGNGSVSYASYDAVVKSVYERTMNDFLPNQVAKDNEVTKASVTIASDGTVISARITAPSGDLGWDTAVQHTLDRVTFVAPFPEGATEKERTYPISFNPQVQRGF